MAGLAPSSSSSTAGWPLQKPFHLHAVASGSAGLKRLQASQALQWCWLCRAAAGDVAGLPAAQERLFHQHAASLG